MSEKKLPQKLKELRKVNNYTQDYVAAYLVLSARHTAIMKLADGHRMPKHYTNWRVYTTFRLTISCI